MGSDDSHFNVALTATDIDRKLAVLCPVNHYGYVSNYRTTIVAEKGETSKRGIEPASSVYQPLRLTAGPNRLTHLKHWATYCFNSATVCVHPCVVAFDWLNVET